MGTVQSVKYNDNVYNVIQASFAHPYIVGRKSGSTVLAGPKRPYLSVCLLHTVTALIASALSAFGTMATPTSSDAGEPPPTTWPRLQAGRQAESMQGGTAAVGEGQTAGADLPLG